MERFACNCVTNRNIDCGTCPVVAVAAEEMQRRRAEPTNEILLDVAKAHCPDGLSPKSFGDPLLLVNTNGQSGTDREVLTGAEATI